MTANQQACECHPLPGATRRAVLRGALGVAVTGAAVAAGARPAAAGGAVPPGVTDVTGTPAASPQAGDALFGLVQLAGDTHVHDDHSADGSFLRQTASQSAPGNLGVGDQVAQAGRTGLDWLPLTDHRTYSQHWDPQWTSSTVLLLPGEEANGSPHAIVLGGVDEIVDGRNPVGSAEHRHVQQSLWEAHAMGAAWGTAHPTYQGEDALRVNGNVVGVDWIELWNKAGDPDGDVDYAERQWNAGFRTGVAGACDDHFKELWAAAGPGLPCTTLLAGARSQRGLLDALLAGRMVVGPNRLQAVATLEADLDGDGRFEALGGDEVPARTGAAGRLRVRVVAGTGLTLLIWASPGRSTGAPLLSLPVATPDLTLTVPVTVPAGAGWWRVELRGAGGPSGLRGQTDPLDQFMGATAPVFSYTVAPAVPAPASPLPDPIAGAAADDDSAPLVLTGAGRFTGFPDIAVSGGTTHVVAERQVDGGSVVVHRRVPGGAESVLSAPAAGAGSPAARHPRVAAAGRDVWVVWSEDRGTQLPHRPDIYARHSRDDGRSFDAEVRVTSVPAGVRAEHPSVLLTPSGAPLVAWQENTGARAFDVLAQLLGVDAAPASLASTGKTVVDPTPADTRSAVYPASLFPDSTMLPGGDVAVVWQDDRSDPDPLFTGHTSLAGTATVTTDPDSWEPLLSVRVAGSSAWSPPRRVRPDASQAQRHPAIAARPDGLLVCVWETKPTATSSGTDVTLRWSSSRDAGRTWTTATGLDVPAAGMNQRPRLAVDPDGALRVVFYDSRSADWRWRVRTARLSDDGTTWTDARDLSTAGNATFPSVSAGSVVWATDRGAAVQRDRTQQVALAQAVGASPSPALPEAPLGLLVPVAGAAAGAVLLAHRRHGPPPA